MSDFFEEEKSFIRKIAPKSVFVWLSVISIALMIFTVLFDSPNGIEVAGDRIKYYIGVCSNFIALITLFISWILFKRKQKYLKKFNGKKDKYVYLPCFIGQLFLCIGFLLFNLRSFHLTFEQNQWSYCIKWLQLLVIIMALSGFFFYTGRTNFDYSGSVTGTINYLVFSLLFLILSIIDAIVFGFRWTGIFEPLSIVLYLISFGFFFANVTIEYVEPRDTSFMNKKEQQLEYLRRIDERTASMDERTASMDEKIDGLSRSILSLIDDISQEKEKNSQYDNLTEEVLEQKQAEFIEKMTARIIDSIKENKSSKEKEESLLKGMFGNTWAALDEYTRNALLSARVLLSNCSGPDFSSLDHSGVVISATSALENELKRRLFSGYQVFMKTKYGNPNSGEWPDLLVFRNKKGEVVLNKSFTLGSLPYLFECSDKDKEILSEYLRTILSDNYKSKGVLAFTTPQIGKESFVDRCDKIRRSYRNAAAHTGPVDRNKAEACCKEIIGVNEASEKIGQVQGLLYDLVGMTENYK